VTDVVRVNAARRAAERQGLVLKKSRRRDPRALDYDGHWLLDYSSKRVVVGGEWGTTLEEVEAYLNSGRRRERIKG
jgi:hypothetical protein